MAESSNSRNLLTSLKDKLHLKSSSSTTAESDSTHNEKSPTTTSSLPTQGPTSNRNARSEDDDAARNERGKHIQSVFDTAFGDLRKNDASAFQSKFRKMAKSAFAFYRGSAPLFYSDLEMESSTSGHFLDEKTSRIWIHGDLHAENFGTYMDSKGKLVFNVNDFDEAYIGPFTWDLYRFVASLALLGYEKALSDSQISELVKVYGAAYRERIHLLATKRDDAKRFTLETSEGALLKALQEARVKSRAEMLDQSTKIVDSERRFDRGKKVVELEKEMRGKLEEGYRKYLDTLPPNPRRGSCRIKDAIGKKGVGIGSAGVPSYELLVEGDAEALEYDRIIFLKESQPSAVSRHVHVPEAQSYFKHEGHRTVISQRALQDHADLWVGWTEIDGTGYMVSESSPYAIDIEWSNINDFDEIKKVVKDLGMATAMMHGAADEDSRQSGLVKFSVEKAVDEAIKKDKGGFEKMLDEFAHEYAHRVREDHKLFVDMFRNGQILHLQSNSKGEDP